MSMEDKLNILVLHRMGLPKRRRQAVIDLEYMFPDYASKNNYIVHDSYFKLPDYIKDLEFHAIILGPTFLCARYNPKILRKILKEYDFIKHSTSFKIAMPQDDYDCSLILENWILEWGVDLVYTVLPDYKNIIYPSYIKKGGEIKKAFTGYISNDLIKKWKTPKKHHLRTIDVSYRASKLPANFGSVGNIKSEIASTFINKARDYNLNLDISVEEKDMIPGKNWYTFLENSKFCIVTNSGSSLLDPYGNYRRKVFAHMLNNPNATFQEIKKIYFQNEDNKYIMTAISPRNIEACLSKTVQLATPGKYSNILYENEHFIALEPDCSNIYEVVEKMKDKVYVDKMSENAKECILNTKELYFENHVSSTIDLIKYNVSAKNIRSFSQDKYENIMKKYNADVVSKLDFFWFKIEIFFKIKEFLKLNILPRSFIMRYIIAKLI